MSENLFNLNKKYVLEPGTTPREPPEGKIVEFNQMCHTI